MNIISAAATAVPVVSLAVVILAAWVSVALAIGVVVGRIADERDARHAPLGDANLGPRSLSGTL